jgi:hypothetical protein
MKIQWNIKPDLQFSGIFYHGIYGLENKLIMFCQLLFDIVRYLLGFIVKIYDYAFHHKVAQVFVLHKPNDNF